MRSSLLGCVLLACLTPTGALAADACTCLGPDGVVDISLPTEGDEAQSRPIDEIASFVPPPPEAPAPSVLWCEGSDDPRCIPQQSQPDAPRLSVPGPGAALADADADNVMTPAERRTPHWGQRPLAGIQTRVERPPSA
ncbi:MAG: hypothetical protein AAGE52_17380 [Myxococcota bacterium]